MLQARADRAERRGSRPVDVEKELRKLLALDTPTSNLASDKGLREEVRGLVVARNERRERAGKKPLDVEKEIDRQLADLEACSRVGP